jgi:hypothetical protein
VPVTRVTTPQDVLRALAARHSVHEWISAPFRAEPAYRSALDVLLAGLDALDRGDEAAVAAYLEAGATALSDLEGLRVQLVAMAGPQKTRYIVANETCLFRIEQHDVHLLGAECPAAVAEVDAGGPFRWWGSPILASRAHDDAAPWCPTCRAAAAAELEG